MTGPVEVGWAFMSGSRKAHYFGEDARSLCGRWARMFREPIEPDDGIPSPDDCAPCRRKLEAQQAKAREAAG